jgi:hypothetical protein
LLGFYIRVVNISHTVLNTVCEITYRYKWLAS